MAGLYEMLLEENAPIFGNVAVAPANVATSNARIAGLRQNVADAQTALQRAKDTYNNTVANNRTYPTLLKGNRPAPFNTLEYKALQAAGVVPKPADIGIATTSNVTPDTTALTTAQNALTNAQTRLNNALARQELNKLAGEQAVKWGQTARDAEQQGIERAAQMYQQALQGEAVRNAIMNNAIGTVGNFNFGGGR